VATAQKTVDFVQAQYDQGLTSEVDVTFAKRQSARIQARLPELTATIYGAQSRMAVLLDSDSAVPEVQRPERLPRAPERLRPGLPVDLLRRRPDIRQAIRELAAATGGQADRLNV